MRQVILNQLKAKAEELLAEEQAGFRPGVVEQIFHSQVTKEKHQQHQQDLFHKLMDFKKAFDRVWLAGLWQVLRSFNIEEGLTWAIQALDENSSSAILLSSELGEFFKTTVDVPQGSLLSLILFIEIMQETLMTTTHPSPLVEGPYASYDLPMT